MYDKYFSGNSFGVGASAATRLPKHKGIYISTSGASAGTTFYMINNSGNTFTYNTVFTTGSEIFPFQVWSVLALGSGQTGMYIN